MSDAGGTELDEHGQRPATGRRRPVEDAPADEPGPDGPRVEVAVVGAGIAGLTAAHDLAAGGVDVAVLEAGDRVGGKLRARELAGHATDVGADALLARHRAGVELARRLGLELVHPATGDVQLYVDGSLRSLPSGTVLGAPTDLVALARSRVLSPGGLARAGLEAVWPHRDDGPGDRSVAEVVAQRYGPQVVERLVEPLLGGVYAGRPDRLSVAATAPLVAAASRRGGSMAHALGRLLAERRDGRPLFATPATTMASLAEALAAQLGDRVAMRSPVRGLAAADGGGWTLQVADEPRPLHARVVVLAVPAFVAARLLAGVAPGAAAELAAIEYASVGVVTLRYGDADLADLPRASGILVPRREGLLVKAATWLARKWPHLAPRGAVLRASVGRIDDRGWQDIDDGELAALVDAEVRMLTGLPARATEHLVTRWQDSMPQYDVGHADRVDRVRHGLPAGVLVAGAAYDGIGVSPCVASGHEAAWGAREELG